MTPVSGAVVHSCIGRVVGKYSAVRDAIGEVLPLYGGAKRGPYS
jgi:hypothetical protein